MCGLVYPAKLGVMMIEQKGGEKFETKETSESKSHSLVGSARKASHKRTDLFSTIEKPFLTASCQVCVEKVLKDATTYRLDFCWDCGYESAVGDRVVF